MRHHAMLFTYDDEYKQYAPYGCFETIARAIMYAIKHGYVDHKVMMVTPNLRKVTTL